jgi:hypothetical protein
MVNLTFTWDKMTSNRLLLPGAPQQEAQSDTINAPAKPGRASYLKWHLPYVFEYLFHIAGFLVALLTICVKDLRERS